MIISDLTPVFIWWSVIAVIGIAFFPLTSKVFINFPDRGYAFSKILGIGVISYCVFLLSTLHLLKFTQLNTFLIAAFLCLLSFFVLKITKKKYDLRLRKIFGIIFLEEVIFFVCLLSFSIIRSFQPDIYGIEKFMDLAFINSVLRTDFFPSMDPWFSAKSVNYYYFGHIVAGVLTKITGIPSYISFNLMIATIFGLLFSGAFSIGLTLSEHAVKTLIKRKRIIILAGALLTAFLITLSGNLQVIYAFFVPGTDEAAPFWKLEFSPLSFPNSYWYPTASRFIFNSIHEFPSYSFTLSDLHAHLLDTPFAIFSIGLALSLILRVKNKSAELLSYSDYILISFILSIMYMTNSWDSAVYLLVFISVVLYSLKKRARSLKLVFYNLSKFVSIILSCVFILTLPFNAFFAPFVTGIGINCAPEFLVKIGKIGPLLFESGYCQRTPAWQLLVLYGFFFFFFLAFILFMRKLKEKTTADIFILILFIIGLFLIFFPEFIYLKDIYPSHFRANTMFKLAYQAFIILSVCSSFTVVRIIFSKTSGRTPAIYKSIFIILSLILLKTVFLYPALSLNSYYNNFSKFQNLDGRVYIKNSLPDDFAAIQFINQNIKGQPIILEAVGDSYTDYGRISANTGLSSLSQWPAHEWLWRGSYEVSAGRIEDVKTIYETADSEIAKNLLNKYKVSYVFVGNLERQKYPDLNAEKFSRIGKLVYGHKTAAVYKIADSE